MCSIGGLNSATIPKQIDGRWVDKGSRVNCVQSRRAGIPETDSRPPGSGSKLPSPNPLPKGEGTNAEVIFDLNLTTTKRKLARIVVKVIVGRNYAKSLADRTAV